MLLYTHLPHKPEESVAWKGSQKQAIEVPYPWGPCSLLCHAPEETEKDAAQARSITTETRRGVMQRLSEAPPASYEKKPKYMGKNLIFRYIKKR
jgi:hypothetical protein